MSASAGQPTDKIDASAFSGAAELSATGTVNAILYGDSDGYDTLTAAGSGNDILIGYASHDTLTDSGSGRNILIGAGAGGDDLTGNGNDILVSGTTNYDSDTPASIAALDAILAEWTSTDLLRETDQRDHERRGQEACRRFQFPHDPDGYERQYPLRSKNSDSRAATGSS